jgi:hypothetical protein
MLYKAIVVSYMFDDVFNDFRKFFRPDKYLDYKLLEDLAFGLSPRFFVGNNKEINDYQFTEGHSTIYEEGSEV